MRNLILLIVILGSGLQTTFAQEKTMSKEEIKLDQQKQEDVEWYQLKQIIDDKQFVFKGRILNTTNGTTTLDPRINFVSIQGDNAVVQIASGFGGGQNGIGGYTVDGIIENYVVKAKKVGKAIIVNLVVIPRAGQGVRSQPLNVSFTAFSYDSARMEIGSTGGFMQGEISKIGEAKIFEGNTPN